MKKWIHTSTDERSILGMSTVAYTEDPQQCVLVNPDSRRRGDPYFKYLDASSYMKATRLARISFLAPKLISHSNPRGMRRWKLNSRECRQLQNFLKSKDMSCPALTVYESAKFCWNKEWQFIGQVTPEGYTSREAAYLDGYYDNQDNLQHPSYLPSTLKQPDYTKLEDK